MPRFTLPIFQSNVKADPRPMSKYGLYDAGWSL
jgi:hypothetical protein